MEEDIEKALNNLWNSLDDEFFNLTYSQEQMQKDIRLILNRYNYLDSKNENLINKYKEQEADIYSANCIINEYIESDKEQERVIELYEEKLMFALSPTTHELAQDTKLNFKKIIRENINEDTYTIKKALKDYWNKKAKGE